MAGLHMSRKYTPILYTVASQWLTGILYNADHQLSSKSQISLKNILYNFVLLQAVYCSGKAKEKVQKKPHFTFYHTGTTKYPIMPCN